jgi:phosphonate transport system substrate-binding protein
MRVGIAAAWVFVLAGTGCAAPGEGAAAASGEGPPEPTPAAREPGNDDEAAREHDDESPTQPAPGAPREQTLRIGLVSQRPASIINQYTQLARVLAERAGLANGEAHAAVDADAMIGRLCSGDVDLMIDTANDAARALQACAAVPIAVAAKGGDLRYRSVIFVRTDSPVRTLADLGGRVILFEDPTSTSAYVVPRSMIEGAGLLVEPADRTPTPGVTRFRFVDDELNIIGGVVHGRADAGAISSNDMDEYREDGAEVRTIAESEPVPRTIVLVAPGLAPERVRALRDGLLALAADPAAARALRRARIARFGGFDTSDARALEQIGRAQQPTSLLGGS